MLQFSRVQANDRPCSKRLILGLPLDLLGWRVAHGFYAAPAGGEGALFTLVCPNGFGPSTSSVSISGNGSITKGTGAMPGVRL